MSSPTARSYAADHPHSHHHNTANSPKSSSHRLSLASPLPHLVTLTHAPSLFLGTLHRHEREIVINHQQRVAKKEAEAAIMKYEAGFSHPPASPSTSVSTSPNTSPASKGAQSAATRAALGANASEEDEAEWAAIVAARAAATRRSATLNLEKEMAEERRQKVLEEIEAEGRGLF
jgi:hypothetical protein